MTVDRPLTLDDSTGTSDANGTLLARSTNTGDKADVALNQASIGIVATEPCPVDTLATTLSDAPDATNGAEDAARVSVRRSAICDRPNHATPNGYTISAPSDALSESCCRALLHAPTASTCRQDDGKFGANDGIVTPPLRPAVALKVTGPPAVAAGDASTVTVTALTLTVDGRLAMIDAGTGTLSFSDTGCADPSHDADETPNRATLSSALIVGAGVDGALCNRRYGDAPADCTDAVDNSGPSSDEYEASAPPNFEVRLAPLSHDPLTSTEAPVGTDTPRSTTADGCVEKNRSAPNRLVAVLEKPSSFNIESSIDDDEEALLLPGAWPSSECAAVHTFNDAPPPSQHANRPPPSICTNDDAFSAWPPMPADTLVNKCTRVMFSGTPVLSGCTSNEASNEPEPVMARDASVGDADDANGDHEPPDREPLATSVRLDTSRRAVTLALSCPLAVGGEAALPPRNCTSRLPCSVTDDNAEPSTPSISTDTLAPLNDTPVEAEDAVDTNALAGSTSKARTGADDDSRIAGKIEASSNGIEMLAEMGVANAAGEKSEDTEPGKMASAATPCRLAIDT